MNTEILLQDTNTLLIEDTDIESLNDTLIERAKQIGVPLCEITHLILDYSNLKDENELKQLEQLTNLTTLSLNGLYINDECIHSIEMIPKTTLENLQSFYINFTEINDLSYLKSCLNLEILHAKECPIKIFYTLDTPDQKDRSKLIELDLSNTNFQDFDKLGSHTSLEKLILNGVVLQTASLTCLLNCTNLYSLSIVHDPEVDSSVLIDLKKLINLRILHVPTTTLWYSLRDSVLRSTSQQRAYHAFSTHQYQELIDMMKNDPYFNIFDIRDGKSMFDLIKQYKSDSTIPTRDITSTITLQELEKIMFKKLNTYPIEYTFLEHVKHNRWASIRDYLETNSDTKPKISLLFLTDSQGHNALHIASKYNHIFILNKLIQLDRSESINQTYLRYPNQFNQSALEVAYEAKNYQATFMILLALWEKNQINQEHSPNNSEALQAAIKYQIINESITNKYLSHDNETFSSFYIKCFTEWGKPWYEKLTSNLLPDSDRSKNNFTENVLDALAPPESYLTLKNIADLASYLLSSEENDIFQVDKILMLAHSYRACCYNKVCTTLPLSPRTNISSLNDMQHDSLSLTQFPESVQIVPLTTNIKFVNNDSSLNFTAVDDSATNDIFGPILMNLLMIDGLPQNEDDRLLYVSQMLNALLYMSTTSEQWLNILKFFPEHTTNISRLKNTYDKSNTDEITQWFYFSSAKNPELHDHISKLIQLLIKQTIYYIGISEHYPSCQLEYDASQFPTFITQVQSDINISADIPLTNMIIEYNPQTHQTKLTEEIEKHLKYANSLTQDSLEQTFALLPLVEIYAKLGENAEAYDILLRIKKQLENSINAEEYTNKTNILMYCKTLASLGNYCQRANRLKESIKYHITAVDHIIKYLPNDPLINFYAVRLAQLLSSNKQIELAHYYYKIAYENAKLILPEHNPTLIAITELLAQSHHANRNFEEAIELYSLVIEKNSLIGIDTREMKDTFAHIGFSCYDSQKYSDAYSYFTKCNSEEPNAAQYIELQYWMANCLILDPSIITDFTAADHYLNALKSLKSNMLLNEQQPPSRKIEFIYAHLGYWYIKNKNWHYALDSLLRSEWNASYDPKTQLPLKQIYFDIAKCYEKMNRSTLACQYYEKAIEDTMGQNVVDLHRMELMHKLIELSTNKTIKNKYLRQVKSLVTKKKLTGELQVLALITVGMNERLLKNSLYKFEEALKLRNNLQTYTHSELILLPNRIADCYSKIGCYPLMMLYAFEYAKETKYEYIEDFINFFTIYLKKQLISLSHNSIKKITNFIKSEKCFESFQDIITSLQEILSIDLSELINYPQRQDINIQNNMTEEDINQHAEKIYKLIGNKKVTKLKEKIYNYQNNTIYYKKIINCRIKGTTILGYLLKLINRESPSSIKNDAIDIAQTLVLDFNVDINDYLNISDTGIYSSKKTKSFQNDHFDTDPLPIGMNVLHFSIRFNMPWLFMCLLKRNAYLKSNPSYTNKHDLYVNLNYPMMHPKYYMNNPQTLASAMLEIDNDTTFYSDVLNILTNSENTPDNWSTSSGDSDQSGSRALYYKKWLCDLYKLTIPALNSANNKTSKDSSPRTSPLTPKLSSRSESDPDTLAPLNRALSDNQMSQNHELIDSINIAHYYGVSLQPSFLSSEQQFIKVQALIKRFNEPSILSTKVDTNTAYIEQGISIDLIPGDHYQSKTSLNALRIILDHLKMNDANVFCGLLGIIAKTNVARNSEKYHHVFWKSIYEHCEKHPDLFHHYKDVNKLQLFGHSASKIADFQLVKSLQCISPIPQTKNKHRLCGLLYVIRQDLTTYSNSYNSTQFDMLHHHVLQMVPPMTTDYKKYIKSVKKPGKLTYAAVHHHEINYINQIPYNSIIACIPIVYPNFNKAYDQFYHGDVLSYKFDIYKNIQDKIRTNTICRNDLISSIISSASHLASRIAQNHKDGHTKILALITTDNELCISTTQDYTISYSQDRIDRTPQKAQLTRVVRSSSKHEEASSPNDFCYPRFFNQSQQLTKVPSTYSHFSMFKQKASEVQQTFLNDINEIRSNLKQSVCDLSTVFHSESKCDMP